MKSTQKLLYDDDTLEEEPHGDTIVMVINRESTICIGWTKRGKREREREDYLVLVIICDA